MSVEDNVWQGFVSSVVSENYRHEDDVLSPEDAAWVDSCLVKDPDLSDSNWDAMKDALLDIISFETPSNYNTSVAENDGFQIGSSMDVLMSEEGGMTEGPVGTESDHVPANIFQCLGEIDDNLVPVTEELFRGCLLNDKLKYRDRKQGKKAEVGPDPSLVNEREPSLEDIFKIWDLNTPVEEDELIKQFEKAVAESPLTSQPLVLDDSASSYFCIGTLDDLISGIADLSLHTFSGP